MSAIETSPAAEALPENYELYFDLSVPYVLIPIDLLISSKTESENIKGGTNAVKFMRLAAQGEIPRREPITVRQHLGDDFVIVDGNGTYTAARNMGWNALPAQFEEPEQNT